MNIFESGHFNWIPTSTHGCGVYIVDNGRILCRTRADNNLVGGPGDHVEPGETPIFAAVRETMEEFGIVPENLVQFGYASGREGCIRSTLFVCTNYIGSPRADGKEMKDVMWLTPQEIDSQALFPAFKAGTDKLMETVLPFIGESGTITFNKYKGFNKNQHPHDRETGRFVETGSNGSGTKNPNSKTGTKAQNVEPESGELKKEKSSQLRKGIRSLEKHISKHKQKIADPQAIYKDWDSINEDLKKGRMAHWEGEIRDAEQGIQNRKSELQRRGESYE